MEDLSINDTQSTVKRGFHAASELTGQLCVGSLSIILISVFAAVVSDGDETALKAFGASSAMAIANFTCCIWFNHIANHTRHSWNNADVFYAHAMGMTVPNLKGPKNFKRLNL